MLEGDDQESLELQLPRPGKTNSPFEDNYVIIVGMSVAEQYFISLQKKIFIEIN